MKVVEVVIAVQYRSDGKVSKSSVVDAISNLLLSVDHTKLFQEPVEATYAGYHVSLPPVKKPKKVA